MRLLTFLTLPLILAFACARERPPPKICEPPPPQKKDVRVGSCPVDWGSDAGTDAHEDAPHDG
jgi:hypothetical protein